MEAEEPAEGVFHQHRDRLQVAEINRQMIALSKRTTLPEVTPLPACRLTRSVLPTKPSLDAEMTISH